MKNVDKLEFKPGTKEELLSDFSEHFPYTASRAELDKYPDRYVPWHWHNAVEVFYMESGSLEYHTPGGRLVFPEGTGGLVNSNVLHMTKLQSGTQNNVQLLHIFDPAFISGEKGSLIEQKYVKPLTNASQIEIIALFPDNPKQNEVLELLRKSLALKEEEKGYEIRLRGMLSEIWLRLLDIAKEQMQGGKALQKANEQMKQMMLFVQEHYAEKFTIAQLANAAFLSERGCYRVFQECLHTTPIEYIRSYRLQMACQMLLKKDTSITEIGHACGLGSSSYFGKVFKENRGCTPLEYRRKWRDSDIKGRD